MSKTKEQQRRDRENARRRERRAEQRLQRERKKLRPERISTPQVRAPSERLYTKDEMRDIVKKVLLDPPKLTRAERKALRREQKQKEQKKLQFAPSPATQPVPTKPAAEKEEPKPEQQPDQVQMKKRLRFRFRKQTMPVYAEAPDLVTEQMEPEYTTRLSKDAEVDVKKVQKNPELYIEINMVRKSRLVDTFFIFAEKKKFLYKTKEYNVEEDGIYLLPKKRGKFFMPTSFYREGRPSPVSFRQTNKGITGKALSLLYSENLYSNLLFDVDEQKYNFFIVILLIALLVCWGIMYWMLFMRHGAPPPDGGGVAPPISLILPWRF